MVRRQTQLTGVFQHPVSPEMAMGLVWSGLPEAFLTGMDIARALEEEKYNRAVNLVNTLFNTLSVSGNIEQAKQMLTPGQKTLIQNVIGVNVDAMLDTIPKIKDVLPGSYDIVGEDIANRTWWLSLAYTSVPGNVLKDILGSDKIKTFTGQEITLDPKQLYVVPMDYTRIYQIKTRRDIARENLKTKLLFLGDDKRLETIRTTLNALKEYRYEDWDKANAWLEDTLKELNKIYQGKFGVSLFDDINELYATPTEGQQVIDILLRAIGIKKQLPPQQPKPQQQPTQTETPQTETPQTETRGVKVYSQPKQ